MTTQVIGTEVHDNATLPLADKSWFARLSTWGMVLFALLVIELVFFSITNSSFFGGGLGMSKQVVLFLPTGLVALGLGMVVLTGEIDLSVGAIAATTSVVVGMLLLKGFPIWLSITIALLVGLALGLANGLLVAKLRMNSLLATLAMQFAINALANAMAGSHPPAHFATAFQFFGRGRIAGLAFPLIVFLVLGIIIWLLMSNTSFGRRVCLIGFNRSAGAYSGIPVSRTLIGVFAGSGLMAGLAGVLIASYYDAGRPSSSSALLMPALTCVVLGGIDVFGGKGRMSDVIIAVLLLGFLTQGLLNSGVSSLTATMLQGVLLVVALIIKSSIEGYGPNGLMRRYAKRLGSTTTDSPDPETNEKVKE